MRKLVRIFGLVILTYSIFLCSFLSFASTSEDITSEYNIDENELCDALDIYIMLRDEYGITKKRQLNDIMYASENLSEILNNNKFSLLSDSQNDAITEYADEKYWEGHSDGKTELLREFTFGMLALFVIGFFIARKES